MAARPASVRRLSGCLLLSLAFGSLYAFAVLLTPLEAQLGVSRADVSLVNSAAIVSVTVGVFLCPLALRRMTPARLSLAVGAGAAAGLAIAATGWGYMALFLGYGVIFGLGNGMAYSLFLDQAAGAMPQARGLAIGLATAAYAVGTALFSPVLGYLAAISPTAALLFQATAVAVAAILASLLWSGAGLATGEASAEASVPPLPRLRLFHLWAIYFLGACGSLMMIVHAVALLEARQAPQLLSQIAPSLIAIGNIVGSAAGGRWVDRAGAVLALGVPLAASVAVLAGLLMPLGAWPWLALLTLGGAAYGALIAALPAVIRNEAGAAGFTRAFGLVFTAWGTAGFAGPYLAGLVFDATGSYAVAIAIAAVAAAAALVVCLAIASPAKEEPAG